MRNGIDRRFMLAGLLSVASCTAPVHAPAFQLATTTQSRPGFIEAIRTFARTEHLKFEERTSMLGTFAFFQFILSDWRTYIVIGSDMHAPVPSFGAFENLFRVEITSTQDPMPWALHTDGMRALAVRLRTALTAARDVRVVNVPESTDHASP